MVGKLVDYIATYILINFFTLIASSWQSDGVTSEREAIYWDLTYDEPLPHEGSCLRAAVTAASSPACVYLHISGRKSIY